MADEKTMKRYHVLSHARAHTNTHRHTYVHIHTKFICLKIKAIFRVEKYILHGWH